MNKFSGISCFVMVSALVFASSCSKPAADESAGASNGSQVSQQSGASDRDSAYVMLQGLSLWTRDGGSLKYAKSATLGDRVSLEGKAQMFMSDGKEKEFSPVAVSDGKEYWIRTPYIVQAEYLAVVNDAKCVLYTEPRLINATKALVPRLTVVAVTESDASGSGFIKVSYAAADSTMVSDRWIKSEAIIRNPQDVEAAVVLAVVSKLGEKDKDLKVNILEGAVGAYSSSMLFPDLEAAFQALQGVPAADYVQEYAVLNVGFDSVNVRSAPDASADNVISQLNIGDSVQTVERSSDEYSVNGLTGYWYHISSPVDGWVFGASLAP